MAVYGYLRVSTDMQDSQWQRVGITKKTKELQVEIEEWIIDDGVSGTKEPDERQLGKLLKKIKKGDTIICSELSRLGRNLFMVMRILEYCMKNNVKLYTVKDNYELGDNIQSKVLAFAFGLAAEIERDMISKRTKEALAAKRAQGVILGRPKGVVSESKIAAHENRIIQFLQREYSYTKIAKKLRVHRHTISKYISRNIHLFKYLSDNQFINIVEAYSLITPFHVFIKKKLIDGWTREQIFDYLGSNALVSFSWDTYENYLIVNKDIQSLIQSIIANDRIKSMGAIYKSENGKEGMTRALECERMQVV